MNSLNRFKIIRIVFYAVTLLLLFNLYGICAGEAIIYVDVNSPAGKPDGMSWNTAFRTIQEAINESSSGQSVWVADGVYYEQISLDQGDVLYGGFEGYGGAEETMLNQRDWVKNVTIINGAVPLRGEPGGSDKVNAILDIPKTALMDESKSCVLDGFTITGGKAHAPFPDGVGGGIYCLNADDTNKIENCVIKNNSADYGGGIGFISSSPQIFNCVITGNDGNVSGGGLFLCGKSSPTFTNCEIDNNLCQYNGGGAYSDDSSTTFTNCLIYNNISYMTGGGAFFATESDDINVGIINCSISGNASTFCGGIFAYSIDPFKVVNSIFHQNNDIALYSESSNLTLSHCLFYGNPDSAIAYNIYGYYDDEEMDNVNSDIPGAENNISGDPQFVDWENGNLRIPACSAAVDMGTKKDAPDTDRNGDPRPVDIPGQGEDGTGEEYDIGAYEVQTGKRIAVSPAELEFEQLVNQGALVKPVIISNIGTESLQIRGVSLSGSLDFSFAEPPDMSNLPPCSSRETLIAFDPSSLGLITATITVESDDPDNLQIKAPLLGTGINEPPIAGQYHTGAALDFVKPEDRVIIPGINTLSTDALTVSCWLKSEGAGGGIISYAVSGRDNDILLFNQENLGFYIDNQNVWTGVSFNDNAWHHLAVTWQSSNGRYILYKDGSVAATGILATGAFLQNGGTLVFAEDQDSVGGGFDPYQAYIGELDEVRIWNHVRTEAQIREFMHKELSGYEAGLVGYWNFNNIRNSFVEDSSVNNYHGTIQGAPLWITPSPADIVNDNARVGAHINKDTVFTLSGFDPDGDALSAILTQLPFSGQLYQYDNGSRGVAINLVPTEITDPGNRVIYAPSAPAKGKIEIHSLFYKVNDGFEDSVNTAFLKWEFSDREIDVTGGAHNFGLALIGEPLPPPHFITISNDGSTTLTFYGNEVVLAGVNPEDFIISGDTGESGLGAGQSREVEITFAPQSKGMKTSKLRITSDDLDEPVIEIGLMGFGNTRPIAGKLSAGTALDFLKPADRVIITNFDNLSTDSLTVSCWIKSEGSGDGIVSYAVPGRDNAFLLFNQANFDLYIDNKHVVTGVAFNDNVWHHVAATWQSLDGWINVYKDGDLAATGTLAMGASLQNGGTLVFGEDQDSVGGGFQVNQAYIGALDEVRIWNRVRTQKEIQKDMNRELNGDEPGLVGYWKFNEGVGLMAYDSTSNNKNGILSGAPAWIHSFAMKGIIANFQIFAPNDEDTTITLYGIDADWDSLKAIITNIPPEQKGELYQLAAPGPVRGEKITTINAELTDPYMRLVFAPNSTSDDFTAIIGWKVNDEVVNSNNTGNYAITVNADKLVLNFLLGKTILLPLQRDVLDLNDDGIVDMADVITYYLLY